MNAVSIPQAAKRWIGRCMLAAVLVGAGAALSLVIGWLSALLVWGSILTSFALLYFGLAWGFDE